jgi:hypothetical protein
MTIMLACDTGAGGRMAKPNAAEGGAHDVGTMWTMKRNGYTVRCALLSLPRNWELCVLVDGLPVMTRRCLKMQRAFEVAEEWKYRLEAKGWSEVTPPFPLSAPRDLAHN